MASEMENSAINIKKNSSFIVIKELDIKNWNNLNIKMYVPYLKT